MQIRAAVYRLFPSVPPPVLDTWELWQIGVRLGNDMGETITEAEQVELDRIQAIRSERMREVAEQRKAMTARK